MQYSKLIGVSLSLTSLKSLSDKLFEGDTERGHRWHTNMRLTFLSTAGQSECASVDLVCCN